MRKSLGRKRPFRRTLVLTLVMLAAVFLFGTFALAAGDGADGAPHFAGTAWALLPPLVPLLQPVRARPITITAAKARAKLFFIVSLPPILVLSAL